VSVPLANESDPLPQESFGGIWDCPTEAGAEPVGLDAPFVVGLDAANVLGSTPRLTEKALYADSPDARADAGSVRAAKAKIGGLPVTVFVYRVTPPTGTNGAPAGTVYEVASAEPKPHLLVTATTPAGVKPLPYLTAMLKAGAGKTPRAG